MFLRVKRFGKNKQRKYYYIVKVIKVNGKPIQKVVKYLGNIQDIVDMAGRYHKIKDNIYFSSQKSL